MSIYECRTIVFRSSATIYRLSNDKSLNKYSVIKSINTYGHTKATLEQILNYIYNSQLQKWRIINLRYFNPIGYQSSRMIDQSPLKASTNLLPYINQVTAVVS